MVKSNCPRTSKAMYCMVAWLSLTMEIFYFLGVTQTMSPPHDHQHIVGTYHTANQNHVEQSISTALEARKTWAELPWEQRAGIFLRAAELISGPYRAKINAATMMAQSKTDFF